MEPGLAKTEVYDKKHLYFLKTINDWGENQIQENFLCLV